MPESESTRLRKRQTREWVRVYKESRGCETCGESRSVCLDFHHKDPSKKDFMLSDAERYSLIKVRAEIKKCQLVCANCHRVIHANDYLEQIEALEKDEALPLFDGLS